MFFRQKFAILDKVSQIRGNIGLKNHRLKMMFFGSKFDIFCLKISKVAYEMSHSGQKLPKVAEYFL